MSDENGNSDMIHSDMNWLDDMHRLAAGVCDRTLDADDWTRLETMLATDAKAREFYVRYVDLHAALGEPQARDQRSGVTGQEESMSRDALAERIPTVGPEQRKEEENGDELPAEVKAAIESAKSPAAKTPASPVLGFLGGVIDYVNHSRVLLFWTVAIGIAGWFVFQASSVLLSRILVGNPQLADREPTVHRGPKHPGVGDPDFHPVAHLTSAIDCRWDMGDGAATKGDAKQEPWEIGSDFAAGQRLSLTSGLAEVTFDSGARTILNGPVQFTVGSPLGGHLDLGNLTAKAPHAAAGFTVTTPAGSVVDLGTEFGVHVGVDHAMDVRVYVGSVSVTATAVAGVGSASIRVPAGQSVRVVEGRQVTKIPTGDVAFIRDLEPYLDRPQAHDAYLDLIRDLKPVVWFRMEGSGRTIYDEMGAAPNAPLHWDGPGNPWVGGRIDKSLWLRGPRVRDYAIVPDYPKAVNGKLSVSAWVYADSRPNNATIANNFGRTAGRGQFRLSLVSPKTTAGATGPPPDAVDLFVEISDANHKLVSLREGAQHPFPVDQWQHVSFTADGGTLRLYRQGREVARTSFAGLDWKAAIHSLGIGVRLSDKGDAPDAATPGYWSGKLDEIAIFNSVLGAEDIRRLATAPPK